MSKKDNNQDLDLKLIKDLIGVMDKGKLSKLHIKEKNGFEVLLERENPVAPIASIASHERHHFVPAHPHEALPHAAAKAEESKPGHFVKSPMVGTVYKSPSPDHAPFVVIGDRVEENTVVCIVEAMKVMNEVKAGKSGVIKEILFDNMQPVEFGTKLFRIE
jgi:acetyl-CoA carboxylase biotin carboxyl carrier protein